MQRGDRERAFSELERARSLAPDNAAVALHLAAAYRKFGENARAEMLLRDQLKRTPSDVRVKATLAEIEAVLRPAPVKAAPVPVASGTVVVNATPAPIVPAPKSSMARRPLSAPRPVPTAAP